ncbi:MAG: hypothetical protein HOE53_04405 [Candidatus Magasanikbacteria bacterium]|jgi:hypothetical protein|nr:hypothetical protein [Candidatus Magasanikbacteria bacterium]
MKQLLFVYNADSGLFNALTDAAHKVLSPKTYSCALCKLTHGSVSMKKEWADYIASLPIQSTFLHKDELPKDFAIGGLELPAVLLKEGNSADILISATELEQTASLENLISLLSDRLSL